MDGNDDDDDACGLVGSFWKVMGLKEKRVCEGVMKKVGVFLLKRESGVLVVNNRNGNEERVLVNMIVVAIETVLKRQKGSILVGFFLGLY